jgi:hypothetical protein
MHPPECGYRSLTIANIELSNDNACNGELPHSVAISYTGYGSYTDL